MARELDELVDDFWSQPLDRGPYTYVCADAIFQEVREGGRVVNVPLMHAVGVYADGHREILGLELSTAEDRARWFPLLARIYRSWTVRCPAGDL